MQHRQLPSKSITDTPNPPKNHPRNPNETPLHSFPLLFLCSYSLNLCASQWLSYNPFWRRQT
jgi:hypothetical protein